MTFAILHSERDYWTPVRRLWAGMSRGRRRGRLPGGHIDDRAALRKAISLCRSCLPKFNRRAYDYTTKPDLPFVRGRCDGCSQLGQHRRLFVHRSLVSTL